ncbi:MAG: pyruvate:ferredoxin (flavodoxin) oxidoreductase [Rickettsiales bacterium]|jgi:pyruvate-ferredoxin/flavodoxin oxidoreductase|nr:pyruvate:ferredoxin (flavodoxin) oxidoreductase [Rickettsiales bacterium]
MSKLIVDGNWAAADVAYRLSEFMAIYPITPSSTMGELADEWAFQHKKNIWGAIPQVVEMQGEGGAAGALHGALQMGSMAATFTASQGLLLMIPNMYKIAGEQTPFVIHVAARALAAHALSIFGDHQDVMSVRQTGFAMLSSANVQQAHDMAAIAHAATLRARVPFLHFFDGFRTSHEESMLERIDDEVLHALVPDELLLAARNRGMTPDAPTIRGTAQNPDVYFQGREAANKLYDAAPDIVADVMNEFAALTGRKYGLVEYFGAPNAENIVVAMGSATETIQETLTHLPPKSGLIVVHLYRPFPVSAFLNALPKTAKSIAVLDRTKEPGSIGEPLYQDVVSALQQSALRKAQTASVFGGRYGLGSKEFKPRDVKAIYENMMRGTLRHNFTVGITDDLTNLSLKTDPAFANDDAGYKSAILYGIGSDGTVGAVKNIVKIVGENSDLYPQSYAVYDSKKSGGLTASHLRFAPARIRSQYLVEYADFISVSNFAIAQRFDVFRGLKPGGSVMINTSRAPEEAFANLPRQVQEHLIRIRAHVYFLDANRAASELGLGNRINTFIMLNFFNITEIINPSIAARSAKVAIEKTYRKKGMEIVEANWAAVDRAAEFLHEFKLPSGPSNFAPDFMPAMTADAPVAIAGILGEAAAMRGDELPVSAFGDFGEFPVGTAKYEKRSISEYVATVDLEKCIQCGKCSMLCPHAVIRQNILPKTQSESHKPLIRFADMKTQELGADLQFTLNISPADCTGCTVCVRNCPVKALSMIPAADAVAAGQQDAFDEAVKLPEFPREKLNLNIPKHVELLPHYFEFSGACAGCGETPYIKLMAHLFGDRMVVANATGCSSIYGANLPTTPWCADAEGRGPAWSNSLFEDNAEYGLGMRIALNQKKAALKGLLFELEISNVEALFDETDISRQRENAKTLREKIGAMKNPRARLAESLLGNIVDKSVWIIGGDGWAYDIGYGGLDHILHSGENVNILVLDTEGYSNTGGQQSKSTPFGASMKFSIGGKEHAKKDLGLIAMMSGAYVAQISMGANQAQAVKAFREAESFNGPSIILAYAPCIAHGYDLRNSVEHQIQMVQTGAWPLYRFNPDLIEQGANPLIMDSSAGDNAAEIFREFLKSEGRFKSAQAMNPTKFAGLVERAVSNNEYRRELKKHIASFSMIRNSPKANEG